MKKYKFLFALVFTMFIMLPFKVNAENAIENPYMYMDDISIGESPKTSVSISAIHLNVYDIELVWYESTDGTTFTLMDTSDTFDYNTFYKVVFDTNFTYLQDNMDEGWEFSNINLTIYNNGTEVDSKTFTSGDTLSYIYNPIWKYNISYNMSGVTYEGPNEIVEGESLHIDLQTMEGFRLPYDYEVEYDHKIEVMISGIPTRAYEYDNGEIKINANDIIGDISIKVDAIPLIKVILDANGGTINGTNQYIIEDFENENIFPEPTREGYSFKGWYTKSVGGVYIDDDGQISNGMTIYAHWDKEGSISIDFANMEDIFKITSKEVKWINYLYNKGILISNPNTGEIKNKDGKILMIIDVNNNNKLTMGDNLTSDDNIVYELTEGEKEQLKQNGESDIPDKIEIIVSMNQIYKLVFDANGGTFKNDIKNINIEDIINFDYESFEKPTRDGYTFIGFYTEDGKSYFDVMNSEAGIEEDTTFYAKWELVEENPKTFDGIGTNIFIGTISLMGLVGATIYFRKRNKVRA